jgi:hypothetical protein
VLVFWTNWVRIKVGTQAHSFIHSSSARQPCVGTASPQNYSPFLPILRYTPPPPQFLKHKILTSCHTSLPSRSWSSHFLTSFKFSTKYLLNHSILTSTSEHGQSSGFSWFSRPFQAYFGIVLPAGQKHVLSNPFQFITDRSSHRSTLHSSNTDSIINNKLQKVTRVEHVEGRNRGVTEVTIPPFA